MLQSSDLTTSIAITYTSTGVDFVDATLLRLADGVSRSGVFDEIALMQLVSAAHDLAGIGLDAPISPVFDEVKFAYQDDRNVAITGSWLTVGHADRSELTLNAAGLGPAIPRIDMLWTGSVVANAGDGNAIVDRVDVASLDVSGLDREIAPLPTAPSELEAKRRAALLARVRRGLAQPMAFLDDDLGRLLARLEVKSVGDLMSSPAAAAGATLKIHYAQGTDAEPRRRQFGIAAALLLRPATSSIAALLDETRRIRPYLAQLGFAPPRAAGDRSRRSPVIAWVVPGELFDDPAWPGASAATPADQRRALRRVWAGTWLAREGIGLVVPPN